MKTCWSALGLLLSVSAAASAQAPDGKALYSKNCQMCHGADGNPAPAMLKMMPTLPVLNAAFMASRSEDSVVKVLTNGTQKMKSFKDKMTAAEMAAVAKYAGELAKKAGGSK
jgi:mono/diheme cytochrome c family protein